MSAGAMDSVQMQMRMMDTLSGAELKRMMLSHHTRVMRLMQILRQMMGKTKAASTAHRPLVSQAPRTPRQDRPPR